MLVSVIMPTFNQAAFIQQAIDSVLAQSYVELELVIIDNFSDDNTLEIVSAFKDARIKVVQYNNNGIIASARNFGVKQSSGEIIAFLDSDDVWKPEFLSEQIGALDSEPALVSARHMCIGDQGAFFDHLSHLDGTSIYSVSETELALANPIVTSSVVMKRTNFDAVGGFSESSEFRYIEDWELWSRCMCLGEVLINSKKLIYYRVAAKKDRDLVDVKERHLNVIKKMYVRSQLSFDVFQQANARVFFEVGKELIAAGRSNSASPYLFKALGYRSVSTRVKVMLLLMISLAPRKVARFLLGALLRNRALVRF